MAGRAPLRPLSCRGYPQPHSPGRRHGGPDIPDPHRSDPGTKLDWDFLEPRTLLVGSPENGVEKVQELQEVCNLEYLIVSFAHAGMPLEKTLKNLDLFGAKVVPQFKSQPNR